MWIEIFWNREYLRIQHLVVPRRGWPPKLSHLERRDLLFRPIIARYSIFNLFCYSNPTPPPPFVLSCLLVLSGHILCVRKQEWKTRQWTKGQGSKLQKYPEISVANLSINLKNLDESGEVAAVSTTFKETIERRAQVSRFFGSCSIIFSLLPQNETHNQYVQWKTSAHHEQNIWKICSDSKWQGWKRTL